MSFNAMKWHDQERKSQRHIVHWRNCGKSFYGQIACDPGHRDLTKLEILNTSSHKEITCKECAKLFVTSWERNISHLKERMGL